MFSLALSSWVGISLLAILLRPSHESLLLRVGRAEWGYQSCEGFGALFGAPPFQTTKLAAYYAIWRVKHKCRDRDWKTTVIVFVKAKETRSCCVA
jgi:hypothetical protein